MEGLRPPLSTCDELLLSHPTGYPQAAGPAKDKTQWGIGVFPLPQNSSQKHK